MNPWTCALLITVAGALGGVTNALLTDNGFIIPKLKHKIWCPGFISNVRLWGCQILCVNELSAPSGTRSSKRRANALIARLQFGIGIVHFF